MKKTQSILTLAVIAAIGFFPACRRATNPAETEAAGEERTPHAGRNGDAVGRGPGRRRNRRDPGEDDCLGGDDFGSGRTRIQRPPIGRGLGPPGRPDRTGRGRRRRPGRGRTGSGGDLQPGIPGVADGRPSGRRPRGAPSGRSRGNGRERVSPGRPAEAPCPWD